MNHICPNTHTHTHTHSLSLSLSFFFFCIFAVSAFLLSLKFAILCLFANVGDEIFILFFYHGLPQVSKCLAVKDSKLQRLTTSFEEIKMEEDELFDEFYAKLKDIVNSAFNLGKTILEPKIVRKVLRSLPERFHAKITAIEESQDIDKIPLNELVGNLQTYELGLTKIRKSSKSKSMGLKAKSIDIDEFSDDEDSKMKSYITRQFRKFMKNSNGKC